MISFTKVETKEIDEEYLFEDLKTYLFEKEVFDTSDNYIGNVEYLPKDIQRIIFAKIGAMMINYAKSEDF